MDDSGSVYTIQLDDDLHRIEHAYIEPRTNTKNTIGADLYNTLRE